MSEHRHPPECKKIFALLSQYLDLELPADDCRAIAAHIKDCPPCIEFTESLKKAVDLCREYSTSEVPSPLSAEARSELEAAYSKMLQSRK